MIASYATSDAMRVIPVELSTDELKSLYDRLEPSKQVAERMVELKLGDKEHWPCPRCAEHESRQAAFVRRIRLEVDDEGFFAPAVQERDDKTVGVKGVFGWLGMFANPIGAALDAATGHVLGALGPLGVGYECRRHGEFVVLVLSNEFQPANLFLSRNGEFVKVFARYRVCTGIIQSVDARANVSSALCERILEWDEEPTDPCCGPCSYTCSVHGTQTYHPDGSYDGFEPLVVREEPSGGRMGS